MDPNATYLEMFAAMDDGDHETAREHAENLCDWLDKGGFVPPQYTDVAFRSHIRDVLRRTRYLVV